MNNSKQLEGGLIVANHYVSILYDLRHKVMCNFGQINYDKLDCEVDLVDSRRMLQRIVHLNQSIVEIVHWSVDS